MPIDVRLDRDATRPATGRDVPDRLAGRARRATPWTCQVRARRRRGRGPTSAGTLAAGSPTRRGAAARPYHGRAGPRCGRRRPATTGLRRAAGRPRRRPRRAVRPVPPRARRPRTSAATTEELLAATGRPGPGATPLRRRPVRRHLRQRRRCRPTCRASGAAPTSRPGGAATPSTATWPAALAAAGADRYPGAAAAAVRSARRAPAPTSATTPGGSTGCPGILVPPHLTTPRPAQPLHARWCLTFWTAGAAWMARLYYDYWRYTGDRDFLRDAGAAVPARGGRVLRRLRHRARRRRSASRRRTRRERRRPSADGVASQACVNATMDVAAVRDLLTQPARRGRRRRRPAAAVAGDPATGCPPYQVDPDGSLAEWLWPGLADNHAHRHASHLFGLWYEPDPALLDDPTLRAAAESAVRRRLAWWREHGDEMAFGLAQLGLAAAAPRPGRRGVRGAVPIWPTRYWRANLVLHPQRRRDLQHRHLWRSARAGGGDAGAVRAGRPGPTCCPRCPAPGRPGRSAACCCAAACRVRRLAWSAGPGRRRSWPATGGARLTVSVGRRRLARRPVPVRRRADADGVSVRVRRQPLTFVGLAEKLIPTTEAPQEKTMPYRPPLVPHETFVADPVDLPVRPPGQQGLSALARAEVLTIDSAAVALKGTTADGVTLVAEVGAAGEGVIRVRLSQDSDARSRSARAATLVAPGRDDAARLEVGRRPDPAGHRPAGRGDHPRPVAAAVPRRDRPGAGGGRTPARPTSAGGCARCRSGAPLWMATVVAYHESFTAAADEHFVGLRREVHRVRQARPAGGHVELRRVRRASPTGRTRTCRSTCPAGATACWSTAAWRSSSTCASPPTAACRSSCRTT